MVKYVLAATALKLFSINGATQAAYRKMSNVVGQRMRKDQNLNAYVERGDLLVSLCRKYGVMQDANCVLDLGTGWMHWYGIYTRLHAALHVDCFDIWDNRQFRALTDAFANLRVQWEKDRRITAYQTDVLRRVSEAQSLEELYEVLSLRYAIHKEGSLSAYQDDHYDCVFSLHVLEHIRRDSVERTVFDIYRILKKGGYSIHQIGIDDHLAHYDKKVSPKNYLRYSRRTWRCFFENTVQHVNRLQGSDFLDVFEKAQFESVEVFRDPCDIDQVPIHQEWQHYSKEDLETTCMTIVHRKPG